MLPCCLEGCGVLRSMVIILEGGRKRKERGRERRRGKGREMKRQRMGEGEGEGGPVGKMWWKKK